MKMTGKQGGAHSKTAPERVHAAENRKKAVELRVQGASFAAIGRALGVSAMMAHKYITKELKELAIDTRESTDQLRQMELLRLDRMELALWDQAINDKEYGAVDRVLRIMERRAKLMGLDAPATINKNITITEQDRILLVEQLVEEASIIDSDADEDEEEPLGIESGDAEV